jgi:aminoglycoside phosphotransferase (APT) family kinase protein
VPLAERSDKLHEHLHQSDGLVDRAAVLALWDRLLATPRWSGPPLWIHGDLHPGNLLVSEGRLSAVIDFGDLSAGDPATDLSIAWMLLPPPARSICLASAQNAFDPIDADTLTRARGWALALGLAYLAHSGDDQAMGALGRATVDAALSDETRVDLQ